MCSTNLPPRLPVVGAMPVMDAVYSKLTSPPEWAASPLSFTVTMTLWLPTGPLPTSHVMLVAVAAVTLQLIPPMVTVLSELVELNPDPVMVMAVLRALVP